MARKPDEGSPRDEPICTRFTAEKAAMIDRSRGDLSRSAFVRQAVDEKLERERR